MKNNKILVTGGNGLVGSAIRKVSVDYPDYANELARRISLDNNKKGVLICATGVGMSVAANKYKIGLFMIIIYF